MIESGHSSFFIGPMSKETLPNTDMVVPILVTRRPNRMYNSAIRLAYLVATKTIMGIAIALGLGFLKLGLGNHTKATQIHQTVGLLARSSVR